MSPTLIKLDGILVLDPSIMTAYKVSTLETIVTRPAELP